MDRPLPPDPSLMTTSPQVYLPGNAVALSRSCRLAPADVFTASKHCLQTLPLTLNQIYFGVTKEQAKESACVLRKWMEN